VVVLPVQKADLSSEAIATLNRSLLVAKAQLVVAVAGGESAAARLAAALPAARVVGGDGVSAVASLRLLGAQATRADILHFCPDAAAGGWRVAASKISGEVRDVLASIIVPCWDAGASLAQSLPAVSAAARHVGGELIVIDDASRDDTAAVAAEHADTLVQLTGRARGPAYARNRGVETASGRFLVFVDSDVLVSPEVVAQLIGTLGNDERIGAVFGSFDDGPATAGFACRYRNLLAHELHESMRGEVEIFWAACGAIRRTAFDAVGGFDEWRFSEPEIEGVDLGHRLHRSGIRILLRPELQVTHLRRYSLASLIIGDLQQFVVPLYRVASHGGLPRVGYPVRIEKRASLLVVVGVLALIGGGLGFPGRPLLFGLGIALPLLAVLLRMPLYRFFARHAGLGFALAAIPLHQAHAAATATAALLGRILGSLFGEPRPDALTEAFAEIGHEQWPPVPRRPKPAV
jgi:hypothetical protein